MMALVSRDEYEKRSWDLAWEMAYKAPFGFIAGIAFALLGIGNTAPLVGLSFAMLTPLLVLGAGYRTAHHTRRGYPSASVAVASQFAFLLMLLVAFH
jgi:hypothetical protein